MIGLCKFIVSTSLFPLKLARTYSTFLKDCITEVAWKKPKRIEQATEIQSDSSSISLSIVENEVSPVGAFVETKHGRTHYILKGPEDGDLVIFSHGVSLFGFVWTKLAQYLIAKGYRVLIYDFYGHGYSSTPTLDYTLELFRYQLEEILEKLNLIKAPKSIILVGHSMGGLVSCEFASKHPELIKGLVLMNSVGIPVKPSINYLLGFLLNMGLHLVRKTSLVDVVIHKLGKWFEYQAQRGALSYEELCCVAHDMDESELGLLEQTLDIGSSLSLQKQNSLIEHLKKHSILSGSTVRFVKSLHFLYHTWVYQMKVNSDRTKVLLSLLRNCPLLDADNVENIRLLHAVEEVNSEKKGIPVLIVWGENDGITPVSLTHEFRKCLPHAEVLVIPETDHSVFLQQPSQIFNAMIKFLQKNQQDIKKIEVKPMQQEKKCFVECEGSTL